MEFCYIALLSALALKAVLYRGFNLTSGIVANMCLYVVEVHLSMQCIMVYHRGRLEHNVRKHDMLYHFSVEDSQIYTSFDSNLPGHLANARLQACISDVNNWMSSMDILKLNSDKTEFLVFGFHFRPWPLLPPLLLALILSASQTLPGTLDRCDL